jgi:hypothetical protein
MNDQQSAELIDEITRARDALARAVDGLEQLPDGGITSITYALRQLQFATFHLAAASVTLTRELDR